jgi:hypothetical protein
VLVGRGPFAFKSVVKSLILLRPIVISIITYGRNDNYSYNLVKRTALAFNCLAEVLTNDDEILFADYNTPDHLPTLPEVIWDTLTDKALSLIKVIRISAGLHEAIKKDSPLPILENVSRNAAIARSNPQNHWILSTNPDVLLVLSSQWRNLAELLSSVKDSFYEMPRMDIPESVWSSLNRSDSRTNIRSLRDWLICHRAAVAETSPDWQFQKYILFDAPGDFQLAPREYFFRLRGFDESMNKYFHSDSNLAKRMWLLNGSRTDHLLGKLWVLHQDHYLSGEWAKTVTGIVHNDLSIHVSNQNKIEANGANWGLQDVQLPMFLLSEKIQKERVGFSDCSASISGELPMSQEVDWRTESLYRLCHYQPEVLTLYLRESLRVASPHSLLVYVGQNATTFELIRRMWEEISPSGSPVCDLSVAAERSEILAPDILLIDSYYERSEYTQKRIRLVKEQMERRLTKGQVTEQKASEEIGEFANGIDYEAWQSRLFPLWEKLLPHVNLHPGTLVIVMGCNMYFGAFSKLKEELKRDVGLKVISPRRGTQPMGSTSIYASKNDGRKILRRVLHKIPWLKRSLLGDTTPQIIQGVTLSYHASRNGNSGPELVPLYIHHRLMVLRTK